MSAPGRDTRPWTPSGLATVTGMLAASELVPGDVVAGRYRIERVLGMGAMGVVFQAHDLQLQIDVALKLLRPEMAARPDSFDRFRQELLLARQVSSPYVVRIHDLVQHREAWLISMDFVAGESLERVLAREGVLPVSRALQITRELAQGLAVAHARDVVHRDLKPANVMINGAGQALITDFGVARSMGATGLTATGVVVGTPAYLSPEQAQALPADGRSDLYALGLILHEMLTGKLPFSEGTPSEMLVQRIVRSPVSVRKLKPDVPEWVARLLARMLDVRLGGRFQKAEDIVRAIEAEHVPRAPLSRLARAGWIGLPLLVLALAFGVWQWRSLPDTAIVAVAQQPLDVALMPFRGDTLETPTRALLDGVALYLNADLVASPGLRVSEFERVRNALVRLNFDNITATRNRDQVAAALNVRSLLEGELSASPDGLRLQLQILRPGQDVPDWQYAVSAKDDTALAAAMPEVLTSLRQHLRLQPAAGAASAPSAEAFRELAAAGGERLDADSLTAPEPILAMLWWNRLSHLERSGDLAGAQVEAEEAITSLAPFKGREAVRARALAAVIVGDTDAQLPILEQLSANEADHSVRRLWARALADSGQFEAAGAALRPVIEEDNSDAEAWYAMGKYAFLRSDSRAAIENYLPQAWMLSTRLGNKPLLADTENLLGLGYRSLGQPESAVEYFERAANLRHALGNPRGEAASLQNLAMVRSTLGQFERAERDLQNARELLQPLGDSAALADLENDNGVFQEERGEYRLALEAYRKSLALRQPLNDARAIGESLLNVGFGYYQVGEFDNAQVHWERAQTVYAELNDPGGQVRARQSLGLAQTARGGFAAAREALVESLRVAESAQMAEERAVSLLALAELDRLEGRFADASKRAAQAYDLFAQREDPRGKVEAVLTLAAVALDAGDWQEAGQQLDRLDRAQIDNREQQALYAWRRGQWAAGSGDSTTALAHADQAIADAVAAHSLGTELSARLLKARILVALDQSPAAQSELARARAELLRYASVPLRLDLAATALLVADTSAAAQYQEAQLLLLRLPGWGQAPQLHLLAAARLRTISPGEADRALVAARAAAEKLLAAASERQQLGIRALYAAVLDDGGVSQ